MKGVTMAQTSSPLFRMDTTAGWLDRFGDMNVARSITMGRCSLCQRVLNQVPSPFETKRSYDRWNPNDGPIPDYSAIGMYTVVSDAAKEALARISDTLEFDPVVVVENPKRRKGFGKRGASRLAEELASD